MVSLSTGRCLAVKGDFENGTDVVTAPCTPSSPAERWRVDSARGVVQSSVDPDFRLDSRGSVGKGVGIWECDSVNGDPGADLPFTVDDDGVIRPAIATDTALTPVNGDPGADLRFTVDDDGVIRPAIATDTALTPVNGDGVSLEPLNGTADQRWRAGQAHTAYE